MSKCDGIAESYLQQTGTHLRSLVGGTGCLQVGRITLATVQEESAKDSDADCRLLEHVSTVIPVGVRTRPGCPLRAGERAN